MAKVLNLKRFFHKCVVMDISLLIKPFLLEDGCEDVDKLLSMHINRELAILTTPLAIFEFLNIIARAVDKEKAKIAYKKFKALQIGVVEPDTKFVYRAIEEVCENRKISYYDASYHALAEDFDAVFLTADKKYYNAMKKKGRVELFV